MKSMSTMIKSKYAIDEAVQLSKDSPCIAFQHWGPRLQHFEPEMKAGDMQCPYCKKFAMITCLDETQEKDAPFRRVAICTTADCITLKYSRNFKPSIQEQVIDWKRFGVPLTHEECTFENFQQVITFKERAEKFCSNDHWCLTLHGGSGSGKTHLAVGLMKKFHLLKKEVAIFVSISQILKELRESQALNENEYRVIDAYISRPLLVLDDLGSTRGTDWQVEKIAEILNGRYAEKKKTIITTNLSFDDLEKLYGVRLVRRIGEQGSELTFN